MLFKKMVEHMRDVYFKPRSGGELTYATRGKVPIYLYSELCNTARQLGSSRLLLDNLFSKHKKIIILLQHPDNPMSGHWIGLNFKPEKGEIYFFSSYGGLPDREKLEWMNPSILAKTGQDINILNDGLKSYAFDDGYVIHYNDVPYQKVGDDSATCGIWLAAFLNSDMNPDQFLEYNRKFRMSFYDYFVKYFPKRI